MRWGIRERRILVWEASIDIQVKNFVELVEEEVYFDCGGHNTDGFGEQVSLGDQFVFENIFLTAESREGVCCPKILTCSLGSILHT